MSKKKEIKDEQLSKVAGGVGLYNGECDKCHKIYSTSYECTPIYVSLGCGVELDHYECPDCGGTVHFQNEDLDS